MLLRIKDKHTLVSIFSSVNAPFEVWAYGSRVNGQAHDGSDLDLVIRGPQLQQIPYNILISIKEKIKESNIPIIVELFDWARLPKTFHKNIEENHEILFSNTAIKINEPNNECNKKNN